MGAPTTIKKLARVVQEMSAKLDAIDSLKRSVEEIQESVLILADFFMYSRQS